MGIVQKIDEDKFIIDSISSSGDYDGYICKKISDVFLIESDSKYLQKIAKLKKQTTILHDDIGNDISGVAQQLLLFAKNNGLVINVQLVDSGNNDVQGLVNKIDEGAVEVFAFNEYGEPDGKVTFELDNVTYIICDSDTEKSIKKLIDYRL